MRTTVVTGLLGSGKTTFIRRFLREAKERTVVLVNDFGRTGIDGEIFSAGGIESVELPSGCVCCSLKFDLITTVQRIMKEFAPEHLVIEPSGVAAVSGVLEALESAGSGPATVIGIIDAVEFTELYRSGIYGSFFEDQIRNSDVILVNKIDLVNEHMIVEAEAVIASINPQAILFRTKNAGITLPILSWERPALEGLHRGAGVRGVASPAHCQFETLSFRIDRVPTTRAVTSLFDDLASGRYGAVARAKALVRTMEGPYRFDGTYHRVDVVPFEKDIEDSRLVVIGEGLDGEGIGKVVLRL